MPNAPSSEAQNQYLTAIEAAYALIENNFDQVYDHCTSDKQKAMLRGVHAAARDAFFRGVASMLRDNSPFVVEVYEELTATNEQLKKLTANLQNIAAFLQVAKQAVKLAASLVTLASAI